MRNLLKSILRAVAALMFRFNNPDALMVFCYVAAAAVTLRAAETASRKKLALAGALVGLGFLAKMLQAFVIVPSLLLAYAVAAPASWRKKIVDLLIAFAAMVVTFGWWIASGKSSTSTGRRSRSGGRQRRHDRKGRPRVSRAQGRSETKRREGPGRHE